jgi:hypothetical protein
MSTRCFSRYALPISIDLQRLNNYPKISGINLVTYYAATIFENSIGLSPFLSRLLSACNGTEYWMASWIAIFTIEKFGRRSLMMFGAAGMSASMAILAGALSNINSASLGLLATVFLFVFNSFFAIGWLGMTWLYPAEITPLSIRAPANAISTTANWIVSSASFIPPFPFLRRTPTNS